MRPLTDDDVRDLLPLARRVAAASWRGIPLADRDDVLSDCMLGAVLAARGYDPSLGVPRAAYAATRIRGTVSDGFRARDHVKRVTRAKMRAAGHVPEPAVRLDVDALADVADPHDPYSVVDDRDEMDWRRAWLRAALPSLTERQQQVIRARVAGATQPQVSAALGLDRSRAGQVERAAVRRLRELALDSRR